MKTELEMKLQTILQEKEQKILPKNIKRGVTIFNVEGTVNEGMDTSDATATADDIINPKTAYVNGEKITGSTTINYDYSSSGDPTRLSYSNGVSMHLMDYNVENNIALFSSAIPTTSIKLGRLTSDGNVELLGKTINLSDLGLDATYNIFACASAIRKNDDNTLNIGFTVYASKYNVIIAKLNLETLEITPSTISANLDNYEGWFIKPSPVDNNIFAISQKRERNPRAYVYTAIAKLSGTSVVFSNILNFSVDGWVFHFMNLPKWKSDGTKYIVSFSDGSYVFKYDKVAHTVTNIGTPSKLGCFYKNNTLLLSDGSVVDENNFAAKDKFSWAPTFHYGNKSFMDTFVGDYVITCESKHDTTLNVKLWEINETDRTITTYYTFPFTTTEETYLQVEYPIIQGTTFVITPYIINRNVEMFTCDAVEIVNDINYKNTTYSNTVEGTISTGDVLSGKIAYSQGRRLKGTMPNNGELIYTPGENAITIPAGYTSGGTVNAMDITNSVEYTEILTIANDILGDVPIVEDGLVVHLDAKDGFSSTGWKNQVNSEQLALPVDTNNIAEYAADGIIFTGQKYITPEINQFFGTYEMYIKIPSDFVGENANNGYVRNLPNILGVSTSVWPADDNTYAQFGLGLYANGKLYAGVRRIMYYTVRNIDFIIKDDVFHHIVLVNTATNAKLYIDGTLYYTWNISEIITSQMPKRVGIMYMVDDNSATYAGGNVAHGTIRDIKIYNRALSESEIITNKTALEVKWGGA